MKSEQINAPSKYGPKFLLHFKGYRWIIFLGKIFVLTQTITDKIGQRIN